MPTADSTQPEPDLRQIKSEAKRAFGALAGVTGFGVGDRSIRIYVLDHDVRKRLPAKFKGVRIECVVTGEIIAET